MIRKFEEMSMNAWPAIKTSYYDGWIIRCANKYSRRANSIAPIYPISEDVERKIEVCEKIYRMNNQKTIFKITPAVFPENLDEILEIRGYEALDELNLNEDSCISNTLIRILQQLLKKIKCY